MTDANPQPPPFGDDQRVAVQVFSRQQGGEEVIIGRADAGVFLALPPEAVQVLDDLAAGRTVGEARELYRQRHGETPDLGEFLELLAGKGFVRARAADAVGGEASTATASGPVRKYHFENLPAWVARAFFGPVALALYALVIAAAAVAAALDPSLVPGRMALYFEHYRTPKLLAVIGFSVVTLFVHEMAHLLAARAVGVKARMGIGHRLWILVAETDLTGLWAVPKRQRYLPLLAGPLSDLVSGALLLLLLGAARHGLLHLPALAVELLRAVFFSYVLQFSWQFLMFVRTDFYYVVAAAFDCKNLMGDTEVFLRNLAARVVERPPVDQSHIPAGERRVIRLYSLVWLAGRALAFAFLFMVALPLSVVYVVDVSAVLRAGLAAGPVAYVDTLLLTTFTLTLYAAGMVLWLRSLSRRWRFST